MPSLSSASTAPLDTQTAAPAPTPRGVSLPLLALAVIFIVGAGTVVQILAGDRTWANDPLHSSIEGASALVSLILAYHLLTAAAAGAEPRARMLGLSFLSMGTLDAFHSVLGTGDPVILLRSLACATGGFWFAMTWMPSVGRPGRAAWATAVLACGIGALAILLPDSLPPGVANGRFTAVTTGLHHAAGLLYLAGGARLLLDWRAAGRRDTFLFAATAMLFALAAFWFPFSAPWSATWWLWHFVRVSGSALLLAYLADDRRRTIRGLIDAVASQRQAEADQKMLERSFHQAQKMEAVGRLAGGVAHDFNNLLTVINGYSQLMLLSLPANDPQREQIEEILRAGERATRLTRQLLAFSRKQIVEKKDLEPDALVTDMEKMLRRLIGEDVRLITRLSSAPALVSADPGQLEQVLMNLCVNARDAMPQGGTLTIETATVDLDEAFVRAHPGARPGPQVRISVADTGAGMDAHVMSHLFEPFFTTKGTGNGTGLGLSTVYGIVKQNDGYIDVQSAPGRGSVFAVHLPRRDATAPVAGGDGATDSLPGGTETLLLAEDEDAVRTLACSLLRRLGYTVMGARDGSEAVALGAAHNGRIHLMITDAVMPGLGGHEAAGRLADSRPDMKVLYMSGYTDDTATRKGIADRRLALLQKPFTPESLARKVRSVLDGRPLA